MSDQYEETVRIVRAGELRHSIDEMRAVRIEDGRNTIHEIQMRDEFGEWGSLVVGLARRRKGDRHDPVLGGALSLYRALANLTERHREHFAAKWPEHFPKTPKEVRDARAAVLRARQDADAAEKRLEEAEAFGRRWYDRNQEALALLRKIDPERADLKRVIDILAGWADDDGELPKSLGTGEGPADLSTREGFPGLEGETDA